MSSRHTRGSWLRALAVPMALLVIGAEAGAGVTRVEVEDAIRSGVRFLKKAQKPDGNWDGPPGMTELVTLALLTAGEPPDEAGLARALSLIRDHGPDAQGYGTYAVSLQTMALAAANPQIYRAMIARNAAWLEQSQIHDLARVGVRSRNSSTGSWTYQMQRGGSGDNSNSQYAILGLNAASEAGIPIESNIWNLARLYWEGCQQSDGGWAYRVARLPSTGSMTCVGISSLVITGQPPFSGPGIASGGRDPSLRPRRDRSRAAPWSQLGRQSFPGRYERQRFGRMGALLPLRPGARAGRLTGVRLFGRHDWYREGAEQLVKTQDHLSGSWARRRRPLASTSFALLFLAKGRSPVLIHKLKHAPANDWENDRDDVRNLTALVSRDWKHPLTWQVVDAEANSVEDLLMAPILFMNGHESPRLAPESHRRLREYIEQGGFLLADACCSRVEFDRGFRSLMRDVFPEPQYELKELPPEHPIWRSRHQLAPDVHRLWGIDFGCRTVVVFSPSDLSCFWNQMENAPGEPSVVAASRVGQNVVEYATGRELPADKLDPREIVKNRQEPPKRGALYIAKLKHLGDWNVAPMSIPHLTTGAPRSIGT